MEVGRCADCYGSPVDVVATQHPGTTQTELAALRFAAEGFCAAVADSLRAAEDKGKGGQQVPFHGDFAGASPSTLARLRWWADRLKEPGKDYTEALTECDQLRAKLELARAVVEAARNVCRDGMTQRLIDEIAAFDAAKEKP